MHIQFNVLLWLKLQHCDVHTYMLHTHNTYLSILTENIIMASVTTIQTGKDLALAIAFCLSVD